MELLSCIWNINPDCGKIDRLKKSHNLDNQLLNFFGTHLAIGFASKMVKNIFSIKCESACSYYGRIPIN